MLCCYDDDGVRIVERDSLEPQMPTLVRFCVRLLVDPTIFGHYHSQREGRC